jgi:hypothetical protein
VRSPAGFLGATVGVLVAANVLAHRVVPDEPVAVAAGLVVALVAIARGRLG